MFMIKVDKLKKIINVSTRKRRKIDEKKKKENSIKNRR